jgi:uncharacterized protein (DUF3084 family)
MRLVVKRSFNTAGAHWPWTLYVRLFLSEEEARLLGRYQLQDHTLRSSQVSIVKVDDVLSGATVTAPSVALMMQIEQELREAIGALPGMLSYLRTFSVELSEELLTPDLP